MKIFRKIAAIISSALLVATLCTSVSAEEVVGFDYAPAGDNFVNYDFTADDGATGTLTFTKDEDGNLLFSSYKIDISVPENPEDFPDGDYQYFMSDSDFYDYLNEFAAKNGKTPRPPYYTGIVADFEVEFDQPLSDDTVSMSGGKCYIVDFETMTVSYAGAYCIYGGGIVSDYEESYNVYEYTAEDGAKFYLYFSKESGEYKGCLNDEAEFDYAIDNVNETVTLLDVDTGCKLYSDPDMIPLEDNDVLVDVDFEYTVDVSDHLICVVSGRKFYVVTVDGMNSKVRYMGHSAEYKYISLSGSYDDTFPSEGTGSSQQAEVAAASPKTGNGGGYLKIMLAAAGLAVLAKFAKK